MGSLLSLDLSADKVARAFSLYSSKPPLIERLPRLKRTAGRRACSLLVAVGLLASLVILSSCHSLKPPARPARAITDEIGRRISVAENPERIVSLAPSVTETLFALGLSDRVVGVTSYCDYPPEARLKEPVGDTLRPNLERIIALKPDVVIGSTASQLEQFIQRLEEIGIPVYVSNPHNLDEMIDSINRLGELAGVEDRARRLTGEMRARIESIEARSGGRDRPGVLFMLNSEPLIIAARNSFINDLITRAGGESIAADLNAEYPQYSMETALAKMPEVIFLQTGGGGLPAPLEQTPAGRSGRIFRLDDSILLRPGPRVVEGLEQMASKIHP